MRQSRWPMIMVVLTGGLQACGSSGGGGGAPQFTTSINADKPLVSLTTGELGTLCSDVNRFESLTSVKADSCRISAGVAAGLTAFFSPMATDADLRTACSQSYAECSSSAGVDGTGTSAAVCGMLPANCTATVAELRACLNDQSTQVHDLAGSVPTCQALTRADFKSGAGSTVPAPQEPATCLNFRNKCSGVSDAAKAFVSQYCALVDPCCRAEGVGSQCQALLLDTAARTVFNDASAAVCLDALRQSQTAPGSCSDLRALSGSLTQWAVSPACADVFLSKGTTPPGGACTSEADCAPTSKGNSVCESKIFVDGAAFASERVCIGTSDTPGDGPCIGTIAHINAGTLTSAVGNPGGQGVFCVQGKGVTCDEATRRCVATHGPQQPCNSIDECDNVTTYCNFADGQCEARLVTGATCAGMLVAECEGNGYCDAVSKKCVPAKVGGTACTTDTAEQCASSACIDNRCASALSPVCR